MSREKVSSGASWEKAWPTGVGVVASGRFLFTAGIVARDDAGNIVGPGDMRAQVEQIFRNLAKILEAAGTDFSKVIKFTTFTTDIDAYFSVIDSARKHYIDKPASTAVEVSKLAKPEMMIEVEAIVQLD